MHEIWASLGQGMETSSGQGMSGKPRLSRNWCNDHPYGQCRIGLFCPCSVRMPEKHERDDDIAFAMLVFVDQPWSER